MKIELTKENLPDKINEMLEKAVYLKKQLYLYLNIEHYKMLGKDEYMGVIIVPKEKIPKNTMVLTETDPQTLLETEMIMRAFR